MQQVLVSDTSAQDKTNTFCQYSHSELVLLVLSEAKEPSEGASEESLTQPPNTSKADP